jgi:hypothetical protein
MHRCVAAAAIRMDPGEQAAVCICYVGAASVSINPQQPASHGFFLRLFGFPE